MGVGGMSVGTRGIGKDGSGSLATSIAAALRLISVLGW